MKKLILLSSLTLLFFSFYGCKSKEIDTPEKTFEKAKIYENIKQYPNAIEAYDKVLEATPFFLEAYLRKGKCYQALGNYNEALATYKKGFVIDSENLDLIRALAEIYYFKGEYEDSLKYTDIVRDREATDGFTLNLIGKVHSAQGNLDEASLWLQRAADNTPENPTFLLDLIRVLIAQEKVPEAVRLSESFLQNKYEDPSLEVSLMYVDLLIRTNRFEEALKFLTELDQQSPKNSEILSRIARYYFIHEDDEKALGYLNQSLEKTPSHLQSLLLKGSLLLKQNKGADALVIFQALARNFPNWPDVQLKLGASFQLMGQWEQAKTAYRRLLQMVPGFVPAQVSLANIYFRDGWYEEVEKISQEIFEKEPNNVDALKIYAASLLTQKKYKEAITIYKQVIELLPEMGQNHAFLAELYLSSGDFQTAYLEAQRALKEKPEEVRMLLVSGLCLKFLNLRDRAQAVFRKAVEVDPDYFPARFQLGELYASQKLWEAAEEQYQTILNKQPENIDVLIRIGTVYWRQEKYDKAESFFLDLLEKFPDEYRLYYELGRLYTQQKKLNEAIEKFESVLEKRPNHLLGNLLLANLYRQTGNVEKPESIIRYLIAERPGLNLENELVLLEMAQGEEKNALKTIRALPVQKQKSVKTQFAKGIAFLIADEPEDAAITFRRLQEKLPHNLLFLIAYADAYLQLKSKKKALDVFEGSLQEFPDLSRWYAKFVKALPSSEEKRKETLDQLHRFLLFSYFQWGIQFEGAFEALPETISKNPLFQIVLANSYASSEKWEEADSIYSQVLKTDRRSSYLQYQLGLYYLKRDEKSQASQALVSAVNLNPDSILIRIPLIKLLIDSKRWLEAEQIGLETLKKAPEESTLYYLLADLYTQQKQLQSAVNLMNQLYEQKPQEANAALKLGQLYFNLHEYDKSADALQKFVLYNPRHLIANSLYLRSLLASDRNDELVRLINSIKSNIPKLKTTMPEILFYLKQGEYKKSFRLLEKVDATAFASGPNLFVMGLVFQANGDLEQAKKYFLMGSEKTNDKLLYFLSYLNLLKISVPKEEFEKELTELVKDSEGSAAYADMLQQIVQKGDKSQTSSELFTLNMIYLEILNSWDKKAYIKLEKWIERFPKNLFFYRIAYYITERSRWHEKSLLALEDIIKYYPKDVFALMQLGRYSLGKKDEMSASSYFERVLAVMPENQEALTFLGMIYGNQDKNSEALELYEKALALNENNVIVLNNLAYLYSKGTSKDLERAVKYAEKAYKLSPANGPIIDTLGWIYYQQGRYAEALVYLERARQIIPRFPEVYFHLGKTYSALQDPTKAKEAFQYVLKLDPKGEFSKEAQELLKNL